MHIPHAEGSLAARKSKPTSPSLRIPKASLVAQLLKNLPALQETQVQFLGQEDPLEKEMATHSSILAGEFHGQRPAGYSPQSHKSQTRLSDKTTKAK